MSRPDRFYVFGEVERISVAVVEISSVVIIRFDIAMVGALVRPG